MNICSPAKALAKLRQPCAHWASIAGRCWQSSSYPSTSVGRHAIPITDRPMTSRAQRVHDLSLQLSQRPMNGNASMQYTRYDDTGKAADTDTHPTIPDPETRSQLQSQTKIEIAEQYGLTTRDLRVFDLPSPGFPHILVRAHVILVHLFDLRLLVECDHVLLFHVAGKPADSGNTSRENDGDGDGSASGRGTDNSVSQVFRLNVERKLIDKVNRNTQPFELRVLDAAFASATSVLEAEYSLAAEDVSQVLRKTHQNAPFISDKEKEYESLIHSLLRLSRNLASIEQAARQVRTVTSEVLAEDEDMANMYLTDKSLGKPHPPCDHEEVEYLFEAYFKASDTIVQEAKRMMGNMTRTEETIRAALSVRRNQIMVLEARIEILMLALAGATLVAGWYGMNVVNRSEESRTAFGGIVIGSLLGVGLITWGGLRRLKRISKIRV